MSKIRLNKSHRDILLKYGQDKLSAAINRKKEMSLYDSLLAAVNAAIRKKYPEEHMVILRQYKLARFDRCLRFQFPSGRVDGFSFEYKEERLADLPYSNGCLAGTVYPVDARFEKLFDDYARIKKDNEKEKREKIAGFHALVVAAKTLDDILAVIDLPKDLQESIGKKDSTALVALSPDTLKSLKKDFALKQAA